MTLAKVGQEVVYALLEGGLDIDDDTVEEHRRQWGILRGMLRALDDVYQRPWDGEDVDGKLQLGVSEKEM